jgi:hypothetical protein
MQELTEVDAILEPSIFTLVDAYFANHSVSSKKDLSDYLIQSFMNLPSLMQFIAHELCEPLGIDYQEIQRAKLREIIFDKFCPEVVDGQFNELKVRKKIYFSICFWFYQLIKL